MTTTISCREAAERLGVSLTTVYSLLRDRKLTYIQVAGQKRIPVSSIDEYLHRQTVTAE